MCADLFLTALLIISANLAEKVCKRLKQPSTFSYMLAGMLLASATAPLVR